jgi:hypothetical protein
MSNVSIHQVVWADPLPEPIEEIDLERPVAGGEWSGPTLEVCGWVLGRSAVVTAVEVIHGESVLRRLPVRTRGLDVGGRRPEVERAERAVFSGLVTTLGLPEELGLDLIVVLSGGERVPVARIEGRRGPLRSAYEPTLQPLMVTTLGRMASTWMMGLLAAHPRVVAWRRYPYDCKAAKYWLQVLGTLAEPAMQEEEAVERAHADRWWVGANPFLVPELAREPRPGVGLYTERVAELCMRNIDSWYQELAHGLIKEEVRYFAETFAPSHLPSLARELYPAAKEIFLVRDLRDWICSVLESAGQGGLQGLGGVQDGAVEEAVHRHARDAFALRDQWRARQESSHLVRYEDLVLAPEPTLRGLLEYLDFEAQPSSVEALIEEARLESSGYAHHRTPANARASVGRWRRDLGAGAQAVAEGVLGEVLEAFGYANTDRSEKPARALHV